MVACFRVVMKLELKHIVVAALGALLLVCSCSKTGQNPYSGSYWSGEYPVQTLNETTGEMEDHIGVIGLYFQKEGAECILETGIAEMYAAIRETYLVNWQDMFTFTLFQTAGDQSMVYFSGVISGGNMTLRAFSCDGVSATYELTRLMLE